MSSQHLTKEYPKCVWCGQACGAGLLQDDMHNYFGLLKLEHGSKKCELREMRNKIQQLEARIRKLSGSGGISP